MHDASTFTCDARQLQMDATEDYSELYQKTMENLVLRAENVCTIAQPEEPMPYVRHGACVRLLDVSHTWGVDDERSMIYVEHLCAADLDQHNGPWVGTSMANAYQKYSHFVQAVARATSLYTTHAASCCRTIAVLHGSDPPRRSTAPPFHAFGCVYFVCLNVHSYMRYARSRPLP